MTDRPIPAPDESMTRLTREWFEASVKARYSYRFTWMGRPIIQYPQDIVAMQELIWRVQPDVIVETGIAHGGSLVFYASMLELLGQGQVIGVDVDIRAHNRQAIEAHPMFKRIAMIQGSSIDPAIVQQVRQKIAPGSKVLVALDSSHTHDHVLKELQLYSPLVSRGSYLVVFDTVVEQFPKTFFPDRPWGPGNSPMTAVREFLATTDRFRVDASFDDKLLITVAPSGYLECVKD